MPSSSVALPVARVAVDVSLAHLDRPFDYRVVPDDDQTAVPGARVRVRFAGRLRDGFVLERMVDTDSDRELKALSKVISGEPVLTAEIATLVRAVADHYAGCFADVVRLAVPPRHAATENAAKVVRPPLLEADWSDHGAIGAYPTGSGFLTALRSGGTPRAYWQVIPSSHPSGDWTDGLARAARATAESGRSALLVVPDQRDLARLRVVCTAVLGRSGFVELTAEAGPAARYRAFLAALRGDVRVVIGNRAAAFAPLPDLGLVAVWDDGDDLLAEQRAPYPHARTVLALRAAQQGTAVLLAGYARSCESEQWLRQGWLRELAGDRTQTRHTAPRVRVAGDSDHALARDAAARSARLPHEVFELVRGTLPQGPVLVQVPRSGYLVALVCQDCREPVRCRRCHGPLRSIARSAARSTEHLACAWCGEPRLDWECPICGSRSLRAPVVGADRTAEELGRAFPHTVVRQSGGNAVLTEVPSSPALVVATPGAEPVADGGYAGAVLLDTGLLLLRADLRASEEAIRRWLAVVALVRPGADGGSVIAAGDSSARALQALVRLDPAGFAARELTERAEAHFPPAAKVLTIEGSAAALVEATTLLRLPEPTEVLGPMPGPAASALTGGEAVERLTLRTPLRTGPALVRAVKEMTGVRSAKKSEGPLRVRVDPAVL
ncbi:MAG: primosomal protein N' [Microlunatus sp.]|nr:primosomal protein N' [Microlunatus sp.]